MARGLNKLMIIGHLGADPETRFSAEGKPITHFRVAVNRTRRGADGQAAEEVEWFRCVAFERLAEIAGEYLAKGRAVYVEGRLQSRKYTGNDGVERTAVEVIASDLVLLGGRGDEAGQRARVGADTADDLDDTVPF